MFEYIHKDIKFMALGRCIYIV